METGKFKINGQDIGTTWGLMFTKGTMEELLKFPQRKENYTLNWPDQDGTVRYTTNNYYESVQLNIPAVIVGTDRADFLTKFNAFRAYIIAAGYFELQAISLNLKFTLIYQNMTGYKQVTFSESSKVAGTFVLVVMDDSPNGHTAIVP